MTQTTERISMEEGLDLRKVGIHPNFWYPLARSGDLKKCSTLAVRFAGEPIVMVRAESGRVFALEDRCAHRQVPLHLGVVDGEKLQCSYHAWRFNAEGRIAGIPYLPKGARPPCGVRSYACREAYDHVFVFGGDRELADPTPLPPVPAWSSADYLKMYYSREVRCHYSFMHENLMDMNHQFLHRRLMGRIKPILLGYEKGATWVEARYRFERTGGRDHLGADFMMSGGRSRTVPSNGGPAVDRDFDLMTIRTEYPYQRLSVYRSHSADSAFELWAAYVPLDREQRTHRSFGMLMVRKPGIPGASLVLRPFIRYFTESIFKEDRMIVEAEQRAHDLQGSDWNSEVFPLILDLREVLRRNGVPIGPAANVQDTVALPIPKPAGLARVRSWLHRGEQL